MTVQSDIGPWALVPEWVAVALGKDLSPVALYITLGFRADRNTDSWKASRASLAEATGKSVDTVDRWIKALVEVGALTVTANFTADGDRGWSTYTVHQARPQVSESVREGGGTDAATSPLTRGSSNKNPYSRTPIQEPLIALDDFNDWYRRYPRKVARQNAAIAWKRLSKTDRELAMSALPNHVGQWKREQRPIDKVPHPASWLNGRRWEDAITQPRVAGSAQPAAPVVDTAELDRLADEREAATAALLAAGRPSKPLGKVTL